MEAHFANAFEPLLQLQRHGRQRHTRKALLGMEACSALSREFRNVARASLVATYAVLRVESVPCDMAKEGVTRFVDELNMPKSHRAMKADEVK